MVNEFMSIFQLCTRPALELCRRTFFSLQLVMMIARARPRSLKLFPSSSEGAILKSGTVIVAIFSRDKVGATMPNEQVIISSFNRTKAVEMMTTS